MIRETYPSGREVHHEIDANGDLERVWGDRAGTSSTYANAFNYNKSGAVEKMRLGNGKWENTVFNSRMQPTKIGLGTGVASQDLLKLEYEYGATASVNNGNVTKQTITVPGVAHPFVQAYAYDELNRLTTATETQNSTQTWKQAFTFDRFGNRNFDEANTTTLPKNCGSSPNFTVCTADKKIVNPAIDTANNRLSTTDNYAFDNAGNTTGDAEGRTFVYDAENKQVSVSDGSGTIGQYSYDGDGKRIKKYVPSTGEETVFVYDAGGKLIGEYSTIVQTGGNAKTVYTTSDTLGSPRINTDGTGQVLSRHDYHPFGEEISRSGYGSDTIRKQFTGYERDNEINLDFAEARYFASGHGRFSSPDPLLITDERLIDPQQINLFQYSRNNPLKYTDPTGLDIEIEGKEKDWAFDKFKEGLSFANSLGLTEAGKVGVKDGNGRFLDPKNEADSNLLATFASVLEDGAEKDLFNAIIDPNRTGVLKAETRDNDIDIGTQLAVGLNGVDRAEVETTESAGKGKGGLSASDIVKHEAMEAYASAKSGKTLAQDRSAHVYNPYPGFIGEPSKPVGPNDKRVTLIALPLGGRSGRGRYEFVKEFDGRRNHRGPTGNITKVTFKR